MQPDQSAITKVLLIDDDEDDHIVFKLAMTEVDNAVQLFYCSSVDNVQETLLHVRPQLIFLDINLPRINGIECLQQLQQDAVAKSIPVIMYSSSELPKDLQLSYQSGASLYFRKPTELSSLTAALKAMLAMNWQQPGAIQAQYLTDGQFIPYEHVPD